VALQIDRKIQRSLRFRDLLHKMADSSVTVERVKIGYVFGGQLEVPDVQILLNPRLVDRFRNGDVAPLDLILQNNLRRGFLVLGRNLYNF
jgi:hypothetical protein